MRSKKTISIILCALISFGLTVTAYAQDTVVKSNNSVSSTSSINTSSENSSKISKEDAKNIAKKLLSDYFNITIDDTQYQTNINYRPNYQGMMLGSKNYIWEISWDKYSQDKNVNISVSVDATTGKVINVDNMTYSNEQASVVATLTEDKAKEIGESFLKKINPQEFSQCKLVNDDETNGMRGNPTTYNFSYYRTVNGIPFLDNCINVGVDGITGKISYYYIYWSDDTIPQFSKDNIISQDKANQIFTDNLKLKLTYIAYKNQYGIVSKTSTLKPVYILDSSSGVNIDAKDGTVVNLDSNSSEKKVKDLNEIQKKAFLDSYVPLQNIQKKLDSDSAEAIMKQIVHDTFGKEYDIQSISYEDSNLGNGQNTSLWSGQFNKKDSNNGFGDQGSIAINSLTGQIIYLNKFNPYESSTSNSNTAKKITWEQGCDKAIEIVKKYFPDRVKDIDTEQTYTQQIDYFNNVAQVDRIYNYNFTRVLNGIPYQDNSINISFDTTTGNLEGIYSNWTQDLNAPSLDASMSQADAQKLYLNKFSPELGYKLINNSKDLKNPNMEVKLVYSVLSALQYNQYTNIDAVTGKFVNYNGEEIDNDMTKFKNAIKGSSAEKELSILASQGIISTKDFSLSKKITRLDLIKMLVNAKGYTPYMAGTSPDLKINYNGTKGDETYKYLQMAVTYGILDNSGDFKGDETITREEMIKDIVKFMGYDKIAKAKNIFVLSYSDAKLINSNDLGYVAISKGLGLTDDTDNKFRPNDTATITDTAVSIYRAMVSLGK